MLKNVGAKSSAKNICTSWVTTYLTTGWITDTIILAAQRSANTGEAQVYVEACEHQLPIC